MLVKEIKQKLEERKDRSAWDKGITLYAFDLLEIFNDDEDLARSPQLEKVILNGADSWGQYSWGGCSLIYNEDIAKRLCSPSEFKKSKNGQYRPNKYEEWLDLQARVLRYAYNRIVRVLPKKRSYTIKKEIA